MTLLKMSTYAMVSVLMMSSAYDKVGFGAVILWAAGVLASINAGLYFWEWSEPENFRSYIESNKNWRSITNCLFFMMVFAGALYVFTV